MALNFAVKYGGAMHGELTPTADYVSLAQIHTQTHKHIAAQLCSVVSVRHSVAVERIAYV